MLFDSTAAVVLFFVPWLALCSHRSCAFRSYGPIELTDQSITRFAAHLKDGPTCPLAVQLRDCIRKSESCQELCMKYLIGSVAVIGEVDKCALSTLHSICCGQRTTYLTDLLRELIQKNGSGTIARFIVNNSRYTPPNGLRNLILKLVKENPNAMERIIMKAVSILKDRPCSSYEYHRMLRCLPVERQHKMIGASEIPLDMLCHVYSAGGADPLLRRIFLLARRSHSPNPEIRRRIASKRSFFEQSLADDDVMESIESPCPDKIATLSDDVLSYISRFMDIETLVFVMPLVCSSWRALHRTIMMHDTRIHDLYLHDLSHSKLDDVFTIAPWKYCLRDRVNALYYLWLCIRDGALGRAGSEYMLQCNLRDYMKAIVEGKTDLPQIADCPTQYDAFIRLFGMIYDFCSSARPILDKPKFLTDEEYELAVYHFVGERRCVLELSASLISNDMPKLFSMIGENEELMRKLVPSNFFSFVGASITLILHGQTKAIPEKLAKLIFSQTQLFRGLVQPELVPTNEYYSFIVESDILAEVVIDAYAVTRFREFLVSFVLSLKDKPGMANRIVELIAGELSNPGNSHLRKITLMLGLDNSRTFIASKGYPQEDVDFFSRTMVRCGLWERSDGA